MGFMGFMLADCLGKFKTRHSQALFMQSTNTPCNLLFVCGIKLILYPITSQRLYRVSYMTLSHE
jgi:hypothetical protein